MNFIKRKLSNKLLKKSNRINEAKEVKLPKLNTILKDKKILKLVSEYPIILVDYPDSRLPLDVLIDYDDEGEYDNTRIEDLNNFLSKYNFEAFLTFDEEGVDLKIEISKISRIVDLVSKGYKCYENSGNGSNVLFLFLKEK